MHPKFTRPRSLLRLTSILTLASVLASSAPASAAGATEDTDLARARALFDEAGQLEEKGQWEAAQDRLRAALRIRQTPQLRYALGWALENDGHLLAAKAEYEAALELVAQGPSSAGGEVQRLARARIADLERVTPRIQVRSDAAKRGEASVLVDDRNVVLSDNVVSIPVDPGTRDVRVLRGGKHGPALRLVMTRGTTRVVDVRTDDTVAARDPVQDRHATVVRSTSSSREKAPRRSVDPLPWALVVGGGVLALGGTAALASSAGGGSHDEGMQVGGIVAGGVGLAGVAVGVYMLVDESRQTERATDVNASLKNAPKDKKARLRVNATPTASGGFASASFDF